jgi:NAD(P)-dependent dehydrogenase (short-subunit alcohol dehydrogenase family)
MARTTFDFDGETVLVTGGSSGIGRAIARRFGEAGANVYNADLREAPKDVGSETPTHEAIEDAGGEAHFLETDVSDPATIEAAIDVAADECGLDVLVSNAGIFLEGSIHETDQMELDQLYQVNVRGMFFANQYAGNRMIADGTEGTIVNISSISAEMAQFGQTQYDLTKGAIKMVTRGAALEFAEHGIRVNAVAPGHVGTEIVEGLTEEETTTENEDRLKPIPLRRPGNPADVAGSVCFLATEDAGYVTGETLFVDGGLGAI